MADDTPQPRTLRSMIQESGVIVVSILLAFALDALWEESKRAKEADLALVSLQAESLANLEACEEVYRYHFRQAERFSAFMALPDEAVLAMSDKEATEMTFVFCGPRTFDPALGTTNSVINTGTFSILQDAELRNELDTFLNLTEDTREDVNNMLSYMRSLGEFEVSLGGPWGYPNQTSWPGTTAPDTSYLRPLDAAKLLELRGNPDYMGRVKVYQFTAAWYASELERLAAQIRKVLGILETLRA